MKIFTKICQTSGIKEKSYRTKFFEWKTLSERIREYALLIFSDAYVVTVAFIAFENERIEKLSFSFSRRRVYGPCGGAKMWK